ncbi:hypothetical protein M8J75_012942 [Diaphorina citri]|nr:hypothetical protein M8J75_012942 [Diaphorina citri]KAI5756491.1 hypothetical protein M8J77_025468 [Diaphorina citri]
MCALQSNNAELTQLLCTVQNVPKRSHPPGCIPNNNEGNKKCAIANQFGNIQDGQQRQLYNMTTNNNIQSPVTNCMPTHISYPNQNNQTVSTGTQHLCPVQNPQPIYPVQNNIQPIYSPNLPNNNFNPFSSNNAQSYCIPNVSPECGPQVNSHPIFQSPFSNVQSVGVGNTPFYAPNVASPTFNAPVPSVSPWNVNPWPPSSPSPYINCQPSPISPSIPLQSSSFPHVPYTTTSKVYNIPSICQSLSPKPLGKLLFPTIYDFKHGSFFKMLIHMSGFEAKNINISANKNSIELRAVKEEIEKQVQDFSGYILKQVARIFYFPEAIEENKIQISINENVIGILIPWKQNAC